MIVRIICRTAAARIFYGYEGNRCQIQYRKKFFVTNPRDVRLMGKQRTAGHGLNSITAAAEADPIRYREKR